MRCKLKRLGDGHEEFYTEQENVSTEGYTISTKHLYIIYRQKIKVHLGNFRFCISFFQRLMVLYTFGEK
ncbi:hypothetical protein D7Z94_00135 [Ulvibacterium marinum]|uniref:Uncharacterized protein n=1 Tax=Ulvibacterium marinum TaxID=2419782 RepID=A0A3B0CF35_9FLAO|nr:hypothetical protein D7Z94_00135 [Ulvibacterium marinum]